MKEKIRNIFLSGGGKRRPFNFAKRAFFKSKTFQKLATYDHMSFLENSFTVPKNWRGLFHKHLGLKTLRYSGKYIVKSDPSGNFEKNPEKVSRYQNGLVP